MMFENLTFAEMVFGACAGIMNSMAILFNSDYDTVNVILFDLIEPGLVVILLVGVFLSFFSKLSRISKIIGWISVAIIVIILIVLILSAIAALLHIHGGVIDTELLTISSAPQDSFIHSAFDWTVNFLVASKTNIGVTYYALNIWLYIAVLPCIILTEQLIIFRR